MKSPTKLALGLTGIQRQLSSQPIGDGVALTSIRHPDTRPRPLQRRRPISKEALETIEITLPAAAVKRWRAENPEAYRAYQREYMRRKRAAKAARTP